MKMYWLPHCTTCQKAAEYLENKGVAVESFHDVKTERLSRAEVQKLAALVGGPEALFSRRAMKYRSMNLGERELDDDDLLDLMAEEYTFIRRPVLVDGGRAVAGFTPKIYDKFLQK
jgi:arsenate reductase